MKNNIDYILSIIAFLIAIYNWYYSIKTAKKLRKINEEFTNIYIENEIKENKFNTSSEFDKIIENFIKKSRESLDYIDNKNLQKLCLDLYSLKEMLSVERKNYIAYDFINTLNESEKIPFFKLVSEFKEEIDDYRESCLKNDFEKIKKNGV